MFAASTYQQRRQTLARRLGGGLVLFPGNEESPMNYPDNCYRFRQDSSFLYYFGIDFPGITALMDIDENREILFGDNYTIDDIVWMGPQPTMEERAAAVGVAQVLPTGEIASCIAKALQQHRQIHFVQPYHHAVQIKLAEWLGCRPGELESKVSLPLTKAIIAQREIKSAEEIAEIEKGVDISVDMHIAAMQTARPGVYEAEVAAKVYEIALAADGDISFPIIASKNGQTLHNHYHGNLLKAGDLFLLDAGAETPSHYCGDLSSTFPVSSRFTDRQKMMYEISLQSHFTAIEHLAEGVAYRDVHFAVCRKIADNMKALGLLRGATDDIVAAGAHALFLPHGLGHQMGLDVHDMENLGEVYVGYDEGECKSTQFGLKSLRFAKKLRPGHVFTVEPGLYFIPELMDLWQQRHINDEFINWKEVGKWRDFGGIRNEENYTVTADGPRRLGHKQKPKTVEEVEAITAKRLG